MPAADGKFVLMTACVEAFAVSVRIPRHSATRSTNIRPVIPPTSGHPFHEHPATWEAGLRGKLSSLISGYPVKGFPG
jgi:hypothetical protein